jgi:hypothetical protein
MQNLIAKIRDVLVATLEGVVPGAAERILAAPVSTPSANLRPLIVLSSGDLAMASQAPDNQDSRPRPQPHQQRIAVVPAAPQGPYVLQHPPLRGTVQATAVVAEGQVAERRLRLQETQDFAIDAAGPSITFIRDVSAASAVLVGYSFVGIFTVHDFQQTLVIEIIAADVPQVEQLASLTTGTLFTAQGELLDACNRDPVFQTTYTAGSVTTTHRLSRLHLLTAQMAYAPSPKMTLNVRVSGQITAARALEGGFGLIEKVHSPGASSNLPVDVEIGLE